MAIASSFSRHPNGRPLHYRTPSPPRRAVEPISPYPVKDIPSSPRLLSRIPPPALNLEKNKHHVSRNGDRTFTSAGGSRHRSGHGRSGSTIDTLATIALATSPTFSQNPYSPTSLSASATPLFGFDTSDWAEPPRKKPRSEKNSSPIHQNNHHHTHHSHHHQRTISGPGASLPSISDSMKFDAELLLNFARPNFAPISSRDEQLYGYAKETKHDLGNNGHVRFDEQIPAARRGEFGTPPSRMRSQSDGSVMSRPFVQGMRSNANNSSLQEAGDVGQLDGGAQRSGKEATAQHLDGKPTDPPLPKKEHEEEEREIKSGNNVTQEATCASCNLVRIPTDTEAEGEGEEEVTWIGCDGCKRWFHICCAGFENDRQVRTVDKFICNECRPIYGPTTFVRKSSRARTAIDYAGLHQGLVKSAADNMEHHYIEPIKQGSIRFLPEKFPRIRAELVSAEFFESGNGMLEPVVIPASFNSWRPHEREHEHDGTVERSEFDSLVQEAPNQEMFDEMLEHIPNPETGKGHEQVVDCGQDLLDMVIPQGLTVRKVADLYGPEERVEVIDVKSQQGEDKRWNMGRWADYYESPGGKAVRNVISLEVSQSPLGKLIRRPKVVRDLDLQDSVWPDELKAVGDYPKVQFYCLMSVADCYTDFHIDFGGSWVYYHILKGKKVFFFIPPKDKHLKKYEEWCNSPTQDSTFLGDLTKECYRVDLSEGDTMLIPSGWIHAVWTPENSLVIGGNFLTRLSYDMQTRIAKIEKDTKVPRKFRYPFFQKIQWYTALKYLKDDPIPRTVFDSFSKDETYYFKREYPIYYEFGERTNPETVPGSPYYNSRAYSKAELDGLHSLASYLLRTALIAGSYAVDGVTIDTRNAVKRSIPKGIGDPVDVIRRFGIWVAWKIGNEPAPRWVHPGVIEAEPKLFLSEKRPGRTSRRSERHHNHVDKMSTERGFSGFEKQSPNDNTNSNSTLSFVQPPPPPQQQHSNSPATTKTSSAMSVVVKDQNPKRGATTTTTTQRRGSGLGPKRVACDACRKRRIRCCHKDDQSDVTLDQVQTNDDGTEAGPQRSSLTVRDAASALNSLATIASENGVHPTDSLIEMNRSDGDFEYGSDLLANTHTPGVYASANANASVNKVGGGGGDYGSGKKGRSKACDDCRKSKVRLIYPRLVSKFIVPFD